MFRFSPDCSLLTYDARHYACIAAEMCNARTFLHTNILPCPECRRQPRTKPARKTTKVLSKQHASEHNVTPADPTSAHVNHSATQGAKRMQCAQAQVTSSDSTTTNSQTWPLQVRYRTAVDYCC